MILVCGCGLLSPLSPTHPPCPCCIAITKESDGTKGHFCVSQFIQRHAGGGGATKRGGKHMRAKRNQMQTNVDNASKRISEKRKQSQANGQTPTIASTPLYPSPSFAASAICSSLHVGFSCERANIW